MWQKKIDGGHQRVGWTRRTLGGVVIGGGLLIGLAVGGYLVLGDLFGSASAACPDVGEQIGTDGGRVVESELVVVNGEETCEIVVQDGAFIPPPSD